MKGKIAAPWSWLIVGMLGLLVAACGSGDSTRAAGEDDGTNWQHFGRTASEDHFSPLNEINDGNISRLGLAWSYDLDDFDTFTAPLAVDGVLYFGVGNSVLRAIEAHTGRLLWEYDPEVYNQEGRMVRAGWGIRGIAYADGKVFTGTRDGRLIAVNARNGELLWSVDTLDEADGGYITGPPWIAGNKVVIGFGGADYQPVRGYVTAYDIDTGERAWRFYTVPGNPADGFENEAMEMAARTWTGEWWRFGGAGGTVWHAMAYDPQFNRIYLGTGNGSPWNQRIRSPEGGDNLFLASIVAVDADTGEYVWHYQANPGETWDFNNTMDIQLADLTIDGQRRPVIIHAPKNGFFYVIDRTNGRLISAEKFARATWAERIDLETGRPVETPNARYQDGPVVIYPFPTGAHGVQSMSFNRRTGLVYIPVMEGGRVFVDPPNVDEWQYGRRGNVHTGLGAPPPDIAVPPPTSALIAWDPIAQREVWRVPHTGVLNGGTITTAGNLVFQGLNNGEFVAYAADSGRRLWSFNAQNGILGNAITYRAGGRQYVTVITGFRSSFLHQPNWDYRQQRRRALTFALDGNVQLPAMEDIPDSPVQDPADFRIDPRRAAAGATIYNSSCVICHGVGMRAGGAAPDLRTATSPLDAQAFASIVRNGLMQRGMPRFSELSDEELEGLRHYIRQRARETRSEGEASSPPPR